MKTFIHLSLLVGLVVALSSCSSSQTFTVQGYPGTVIMTPDYKPIATIDNFGKADITLERKGFYCHFLQAQALGSNIAVPFALDYQDKNRVLNSLALWCAAGALAGGAAGYYSVENKPSKAVVGGLTMAVAGAGLGLLGAAFGPLEPIKENYNYLELQTTNNDIIR